MDDSKTETKIFSVRIVSIDYYMASPIPEVDISYSSFQGGNVYEVPVIRIYGSTPAGQKACVHVHGALPYLYVPVSEIPIQASPDGDAYKNAVCLAIEKALKLKGTAGSKRKHVHGSDLVRAKRLYGCHSQEELFLKIYLYYPQDVSRAANLLLAGAVLERSIQPHESHIPFLLQFLVDYNLYGMGLLHLAKVKFRLPVPDDLSSSQISIVSPKYLTATSDIQEESIIASQSSSHIWGESTIPDGWIWPYYGDFATSSDQGAYQVKRQSTCQLEADTIVDDILNQQCKIYTSFSQSEADVKMVQSLVPIWQEEYERNGIHEEKAPPDPGKPQPNFVLKALLSNGLDYEHKFLDLCNRLEEALSPFSEKDGNAVFGMGSENTDGQSSRSLPELQDKISCKVDERPGSGAGELVEAADEEALALLNWLASSQAAEDSNSDDDFVRETMLSPLLPVATMNKVIEKANGKYEDESQRECQDILDSVEDFTDLHGQKLKAPIENSEYAVESFSLQKVPQVDGAGDDMNPASSAKPSNKELNVESTRSQGHMLQDADSGSKSKQKRKRSVWVPLPLTVGCEKSLNTANGSEEYETDASVFQEAKTSLLDPYEHKSSFDHASNTAHVGFQVQDSKTLLGCSVRDLMRKKRSYRSELAECTGSGLKIVLNEKEGASCPGKLESPMGQSDVEILQPIESGGEFHLQSDFFPFQTRPNAAADSLDICTEHLDVLTVTSCSMHEDQLVPPVSESTFHASTSNDRLSKTIYGAGCSSIHDECEKDEETLASIASISASENVAAKEQVEYISMSFRRKPPTAAQMNLPLEYPRLPNHSDHISIGAVHGSLGEFPPFHTEGLQREIFIPEKSTDTEQLCTKLAMGVPVHYQNDGSYSYLLTPAISPPSMDSVCSWLSSQNPGSIVSLDCENGKQLPGSDVASSLNHQGNRNDSSAQEHVIQNDMLVALQDERTPVKANNTTKASEDNSQISGIGVLSKSTPLSQIGFRDPANVGAGQQLTLFSIEVQAESRGDFRPHPQFDGINIISLAIQHDDSSMVEVHLLIRVVNESCGGHLDGISGFEVKAFADERSLLDHFVKITESFDPDILMGWDVQGSSLGFLAERASHLGINLLDKVSRIPHRENTDDGDFETLEEANDLVAPGPAASDAGVLEDAIIEDEWGRTHASGLRVGGRIVLNVWRLMRGEVKLNMYTVEAVSEAVLRQRVPSIHWTVLNKWFSSGPGKARHRCIDYMARRAKLNLDIVNQLDMINRTSELARVFGIDFFSVLSRGSQYRVESMLMRLAHIQNYIAISPGYQQVASQPAMECLPLVMEPESGFYPDPVVVLDFQSLYPSMVIAYNLCFCTCLGKVVPPKPGTLGVSKYCPDMEFIKNLNQDISLTPNGVMYVPSKIRKGVLPRLLEEILSTRIMVKKAMKKLLPSQQILQRIYNARQLALKLIANVTYGYTAAGFSGRMPCAELADSIVQCGRRTLETAISFVNAHEKWNGKVIYGDTDSMFVLLKGRTWKEAFVIGQEIASAITAMNPDPVALKMEKVYQGCFLLTKKRYVGYSYESLDQVEPIFDAKGIETVRRDTCGVVAKMLERSLRTYFEHQEIFKVREYVHRQWSRILSGRVSVQDFVFAKEVRLGTYSDRASSLPPAAIVAMKAMRIDPRAEPRYAERVPYVVIHGEPGARLADLVVDPHDLLAIGSPHRLNDLYYIKKQIIPALQRAFGLVGADLTRWFSEMPRPIRDAPSKHTASSSSHRKRIDYYYYSKHCVLCGELMQAGNHLCARCLQKEDASVAAVIGRTSKLERDIQHLAAICRHCGGGDWLIDSGVKCTSLACSLYFERRKVQKELQALSSIANEAKLYPKCTVEWF